MAEGRRCTGCGIWKPLSSFSKRTSGRGDGFKTRCKECARSAHRKYRRRRGYRRKYGITLAEYDRLLEAQGGVCAICERGDSSGRRLSVDHNHETGQVRGLLCLNCNTVIGLAHEDTDLLHRIAEYLESWSEED